MNGVGRRGGGLGGRFAAGAKQRVRDGQRFRAGKADDGQPALAERGRNRSYGVVQHWIPAAPT